MRQHGFSLIGTMATLVIICILAAVFLTGNILPGGDREHPRADGEGQTIIGRSAARAKDQVCVSNLGQARQALEMARINEEPVYGVSDLQTYGLSPSMLRCPIGSEQYEYEGGKVTCPHPGHEEY